MIRLLAILVLGLLAAPATAAASARMESTFQDDNRLVYTTPAQLRSTLDTLQSLGVDRLRVTVLWKAIAPRPTSRRRPSFDATDPAAYPDGAWRNYDNVVREAYARGIGVNFNLTGPSPLWANRSAPREDIADTFEPSSAEFAQFVGAVGRRYSGDYPSPYDQNKLPRVDYWSIWNEPNHSGWLTPQWSEEGRGFPRAAALYRDLFEGAFAALHATGHGGDTILIGETAPKGISAKGLKKFLKPLVFLRALYCVNRRIRPLTGERARRLGCPEDGRNFRALHVPLFSATGYAHHPYNLLERPRVRPLDRDWVTIGSLGRLTGTLDRIFKRHGSRRRVALYLTEYGYQTPPDPFGVPLGRQGAYLNQSEYIAARNPRVRTMSQFLLEDDGEPIGLTFQSGLLARGGKRKPSYKAYRLPIWVTSRGPSRRVWGLVRPAPFGARVPVEVQFRARGSKTWRRIKTVYTSGERNTVRTRLTVRRRGALRLRWERIASRAARVR